MDIILNCSESKQGNIPINSKQIYDKKLWINNLYEGINALKRHQLSR